MRIMHRIENGYVYLMFETDPENNLWKKAEIINLNDPFKKTWELIKYWDKYNYIDLPGTYKTVDTEVLEAYLLKNVIPDIMKWLDEQKSSMSSLIGYLQPKGGIKDE